MSQLNADCPFFRALVRRSYYTHNPEHDNIFDPVVAFACQSVTNRILTFHCMFDFGMVRSRVPLSALYWKEPTEDIEPHFKVLWDCYLPGTEVLTGIGWKLFENISYEDKLCTVNLVTDQIEYQTPTNIIVKEYAGKIYQFGGKARQKVDLAVTENHRMVVCDWNRIDGKIKLAKDVTSMDRIRLTSNWVVTKPDRVVLKDNNGNDIQAEPAKFASLLGWYVSEGCCYLKQKKYKTVYISQLKSPHREAIKSVLREIGIRFTEEPSNIVIQSDWLYDYLLPLGNCYTKRVPQWVKDADAKTIEVFINSAVDGDGWREYNCRRYATVSKLLADDIQELFFKIGSHANIRTRKAKPYLIRGRAGANTVDQYYVVENKTKTATIPNREKFISKTDYNGPVYCATVPNGTLLVRRNNKMAICGNCFGESFTVTQLSYLYGKRAKVILKDHREIWVTYCFTVDWFDNPFSNEAQDAKNLHVCRVDAGFYIGQPNNRMVWADQNWVTRPFPIPLKDIKVDKEFLRVETFSDRWVSEDTDSFYYDIKEDLRGLK